MSEQTVVITGASSGMGLALALSFAEAGANVVLAARGAAALHDAQRQCLQAGAQGALSVVADVTDEHQVDELAQQATARFGRIDVWINCAGTSLWGPFEEIPSADHARLIAVNLTGVINGSQAAVRHMLAHGGKGLVINFASIAGRVPMAFAASYTATKFGVAGFTEALRDELHGRCEIEVCGVYPTFVDTPTRWRSGNYTGRELRPVPPVLDPRRVAAEVHALVRHPKRALNIGAQHALAWPYGVAPDSAGTLVARLMQRYLLQSGAPAGPSPGALFEPRDLPADVQGGWGVPQRRHARWLLAGALAASAAWLLMRWRPAGGHGA